MKGAPSRLGTFARFILEAGVVAFAYVVAAELGLRLAFANENVSTVWPATGVALAALFLRGGRLWPAIWIGALIANLLNGTGIAVAAGISVGNTLAPLLGMSILRRIGFRPTLERPVGVFALVFGGGFAAMLISATGGTATLAAAGAVGMQGFAQTWLQWWVGDALGVVLVAPLIFVVSGGGWSQLRLRGPEPFVFFAGTAIATWLIFTNELSPNYVALVFGIIAALRYQQPGAVVTTAIVAGVALWATITGHATEQAVSLTTELVELQVFNGAIALASLTLAAVMSQRLRAERDLQLAASELEQRVKDRTKNLETSQRLARIGSFSWDAETNTNTWSDELYRLYGLSPEEEAPGFDEYMQQIHPDFRESVQASVEEVMRTGGHFDHDYKIVHPSGEDRWVQAHGEVVTDENGVLRGLYGTCQDITERKQAEEALRASEEQFRMLVEMSPQATIVVDETGHIQLANDEMNALFGYGPGELIGKRVETLVPVELRSQHAIHRTVYTEDPRRRSMASGIELWGLRKDGSSFAIDITLSPVPTPKGVQVVASVRDVTNQRRAEQTLRAAYERERDAAEHLRNLDESKTIFLEAISHELRTPLTVIVGISSLLRSGELRVDDDQFDDLLGSLDASAQRLHSLLDDLLDLDRLRRGVIKPSRRQTPIAELMARMVHNLDLGEHPVHVDAHEVIANVDPAQTERIVENLVSNALKHTPPDTPIWLRAEPIDGGVLIIVEDSGPGVPENIREKLFDPFVKDMRRHIAGTGIGLSLVDRFSKLHGGRAWVEERPGGGASFRVYLPDKLDDASAPAA